MKICSTEDKIKEAAKEVFISKGFSGCSSREIAKAAGMNVALVNYYFRSKSKLFQLIFNTVIEDFVVSMTSVFATKDVSLEEKMRLFINREYELLAKHPELPNFIINEMSREGSSNINHLFEKISQTGIFEECMVAQSNGTMRKIDLVSITLLILSNCQYPIMAKSLIQGMHKLSDAVYVEYLDTHRNEVTEMLVNFLFPKQS
jgi:AcrR family transcriptional regulator